MDFVLSVCLIKFDLQMSFCASVNNFGGAPSGGISVSVINTRIYSPVINTRIYSPVINTRIYSPVINTRIYSPFYVCSAAVNSFKGMCVKMPTLIQITYFMYFN